MIISPHPTLSFHLSLALLLFSQQERIRKEAEIIGNFKDIVRQKLVSKGGDVDEDEFNTAGGGSGAATPK